MWLLMTVESSGPETESAIGSTVSGIMVVEDVGPGMNNAPKWNGFGSPMWWKAMYFCLFGVPVELERSAQAEQACTCVGGIAE